MIKEQKKRSCGLLKMFSLNSETVPAHYRMCLFNVMLVLFVFSTYLLIELFLDISTMEDLRHSVKTK